MQYLAGSCEICHLTKFFIVVITIKLVFSVTGANRYSSVRETYAGIIRFERNLAIPDIEKLSLVVTLVFNWNCVFTFILYRRF